ALVPWTYFSTALSTGSTSLVGQQNVISKVYFPRLLVPLAAVVGPLVDFAIAFLVLLLLMIWYRRMPGPAVLCVLPLLVLAIMTLAGGVVYFRRVEGTLVDVL